MSRKVNKCDNFAFLNVTGHHYLFMRVKNTNIAKITLILHLNWEECENKDENYENKQDAGDNWNKMINNLFRISLRIL